MGLPDYNNQNATTNLQEESLIIQIAPNTLYKPIYQVFTTKP